MYKIVMIMYGRSISGKKIFNTKEEAEINLSELVDITQKNEADCTYEICDVCFLTDY